MAGAERLVDHQVRAAEELDDKAEQMIRLAMVTMAGAMSVALFVGQEPDIQADAVSAVIYAVGLSANLLAAFLFIHSYVGIGRPIELYPAPSVEWLEAKRDDADWTFHDHLASLISSYAEYSRANVARMTNSAGRRSRGLVWLFAAVLLYSTATALIVGRTIGV